MPVKTAAPAKKSGSSVFVLIGGAVAVILAG